MELFKKKTKGMKSHIANLVAIAMSDGNFSVNEKKLIFEIGERNGITREKVKEIIRMENEDIKFKIPKNDLDRFNKVYELVEMWHADGDKAEQEMDICIEIAEKLGFRKEITGVLVRKLQYGIKAGKTRDELQNECADFLDFKKTE